MGMESIYKLSVVLDMVDRLTSPLMTATDQTSKKLHDMQQSFGLASLAGTAMTTAGLSITKGLLGVAASTFDTQDALAELKSLGVVDLAAVESAAKSFSDTWAGTSKVISFQRPTISSPVSHHCLMREWHSLPSYLV